MKRFSLVWGVLLLAALTGCSRPVGFAMPASPQTPAFKQTARVHHSQQQFIYVAGAGEIWVYPEHPNAPPVETISDGVNDPYGLYVDAAKNLYVANYGNSTVTVYPPGELAPSATYSEGLSRPLYPIEDRNGNVLVTNAPSGGHGTVVEYVGGDSNNAKTISTIGTEADGIDLDRSGNLYVAYRNENGIGGIEKYDSDYTNGRSLGIALDQPEGLIVTRGGKVLVLETGRLNRLEEFPRNSTSPDFVINVPGTPVELAITQSEDRIFVSTLSGSVYTTRYPLASINLTQEIFAGYAVQGVALTNGQHF